MAGNEGNWSGGICHLSVSLSFFLRFSSLLLFFWSKWNFFLFRGGFPPTTTAASAAAASFPLLSFPFLSSFDDNKEESTPRRKPTESPTALSCSLRGSPHRICGRAVNRWRSQSHSHSLLIVIIYIIVVGYLLFAVYFLLFCSFHVFNYCALAFALVWR